MICLSLALAIFGHAASGSTALVAGDKISVLVTAGHNVTLPCTAASVAASSGSGRRHHLIAWSCSGCRRPDSMVLALDAAPAPHLLAKLHTSSLSSETEGRIGVNSSSFALVYSPVLVTDSGRHWCHVTRRSRSIAKSLVDLKVQDVPSPPGRPLIQDFSSRSVHLSWAAASRSNNSPVRHYLIYIRRGENGDWMQRPLVTVDNSTRHRVTELQPFTAYSFRLAAVNRVGASRVGVASYPIITLREAPSSKPTIVAARNTSATSLWLQWRPLSGEQLRGEFQNYRLTYRRANDLPSAIREIHIGSENAQSYTIADLQPFTRYVVSVQVENPAGLGPSSTVVVMTDEGVPGPPRNISVGALTKSSMTVRWLPPARPNANITGYRVYSTELDGRTSVVSVQGSLNTSVTLNNLKPHTGYNVSVLAYTRHAEGHSSSTPAVVFTDVTAPPPPTISALTCQSPLALLVAWRRPAALLDAAQLTFYMVEYTPSLISPAPAPRPSSVSVATRRTHSLDTGAGAASSLTHHVWKRLRVEADVDASQATLLLTNLTAGVSYSIRVRAGATSLYNSSQQLVSRPSRALSINIDTNDGCRSLSPAITAAADSASDGWRHGEAAVTGGGGGGGTGSGAAAKASGSLLDVGAVTMMSLVAVVCVLLLFAVILWRRFMTVTSHDQYQPVSQCVSLHKSQSWERCGANGSRAPISAQLFPIHITEMHADTDIGFCKEYDEILEHTMKLGLPAYISQCDENKPKNRYQNIDAYDHSLVPLRPLAGQRRGDYINANFIDGFLARNRYIGAQGPLTNTFDAFWRMIWEQYVSVIVMITNLVERGRKKCDMYWPKEGVEMYGVIQVELLSERVFATYTIRRMMVRHTKVKAAQKRSWHERELVQFHYTSWPDHGVPDHPLPILDFVRRSASANHPHSRPILVHCSAGVGRTGTYIVLDAMMAMLRRRGAVSVFGFLRHIRQQRNFLVQTEDQYVFVHDALLEWLDAGDTCVPAAQLTDYVRRLRTADVGVYPCYTLDKQYQLVTAYQPKDYELSSARASYNQLKNRSNQFVPVDQWRVHLTPRPGVEGSDYINASFVTGFDKSQEYIITQHPLSETVDDFWRMVWDNNVQTVVVLSPSDQQEFAEFWPSLDDTFDSDCFRVLRTPSASTASTSAATTEPAFASGGCCVVAVQLVATQDDYQLTVHVLLAPQWPHVAATTSAPAAANSGALPLVHTITQYVADSYQNGPLVVIDRYGGTEAAQLCCVASLYKQYMYHSAVDVYMYARLCHMRRPGVWQTQDDYTFLYEAIETAVLSSNSDNSDNNNHYTSTLLRRHNNNNNNNSVRTSLAAAPADVITHAEQASLLSPAAPIALSSLLRMTAPPVLFSCETGDVTVTSPVTSPPRRHSRLIGHVV